MHIGCGCFHYIPRFPIKQRERSLVFENSSAAQQSAYYISSRHKRRLFNVQKQLRRYIYGVLFFRSGYPANPCRRPRRGTRGVGRGQSSGGVRIGQSRSEIARDKTAHGGWRHYRSRPDADPHAVNAVLRTAAYGDSHRLDHGLAERASDRGHHGQPRRTL